MKISEIMKLLENSIQTKTAVKIREYGEGTWEIHAESGDPLVRIGWLFSEVQEIGNEIQLREQYRFLTLPSTFPLVFDSIVLRDRTEHTTGMPYKSFSDTFEESVSVGEKYYFINEHDGQLLSYTKTLNPDHRPPPPKFRIVAQVDDNGLREIEEYVHPK